MSDIPVLQPLTDTVVRHELAALLELDTDTVGQRWSRANWLLDLPGKWELSRVVRRHQELLGVIVASCKADGIHVHRVAIRRDARGRGLGTALFREVARAGVRTGRPSLSLKVDMTNERARQLYERLGLHVVGAEGSQLLMAGACAEVGDAPLPGIR